MKTAAAKNGVNGSMSNCRDDAPEHKGKTPSFHGGKTWWQTGNEQKKQVYPSVKPIDIAEKSLIISSGEALLIEEYKVLGKKIAQLTDAGCIDAAEYWRDGKYLYLLSSMRRGKRKKRYIGSHPARIREALQKLENFQRRAELIARQEVIEGDLQEIGRKLEEIVAMCGGVLDKKQREVSVNGQ